MMAFGRQGTASPLFLTIIIIILLLQYTAISAANVVHLPIERRSLAAPPSLVVEEGFFRRLFRLKSRQTFSEDILNNVALGMYMANVTIGTPGQRVTLQVNTGSSDTYVLASNADICTKVNSTGCAGGTYSSSSSSTYNLVRSGGLNIVFTDGTGAKGDYFTDNLGFGTANVRSLQMGLGINATTDYGPLGLGYRSNEATNITYPNFMDQLVSQGLIGSKTFSLYLNEMNSTYGSLLFGGIDTKKFSGTLGVVNIQNTTTSGFNSAFTVMLTGMSITSGNGTVLTTTLLTNQTGYAQLESGTTLSYVPEEVITKLLPIFGARDTRNASGVIIVDCALATRRNDYITFKFGGLAVGAAPSINVPLSELVGTTQTNRGQVCYLGLSGATPSTQNNKIVLGDTFLRSAYAVFDLDNNQIGLGQTVFGTSESNILEIKAGETALPTAAGVVPTSTAFQSANSTRTAGPATATSGNNGMTNADGDPGTGSGGKKGLGGGAIAGIVIGVFVALSAVALFLFFCLRRSRKAKKESNSTEPNRGSELPTNANTHEIAGKETRGFGYVGTVTELKHELHTQDNKHELSGNGAMPPVTHEIHTQHEVPTQSPQRIAEVPGEHLIEAPSATFSPIDTDFNPSATQFELASDPILPSSSTPNSPISPKRKPVPLSSTLLSSPAFSSSQSPESGSGERNSEGPSKLDILQQRMEKLRKEKERLAKERELEEMERRLQEEIMEELRKEHGGGR